MKQHDRPHPFAENQAEKRQKALDSKAFWRCPALVRMRSAVRIRPAAPKVLISKEIGTFNFAYNNAEMA